MENLQRCRGRLTSAPESFQSFTLIISHRPGNRGKRDSQMVIMRFLNRIHYNLPMTPLELEMHHHIRNIIGVNPTFYEFLFQIDADTVVAPDAATRMISSFLHDTRVIGVCGETALTNAKSSFITMIQVYEYYISHNLTKAFESLFGSVTCLPGCFSMYRIRSADTGKPLFVSKEIIEAYSENRVDTLHLKNLLHLGEDRYLTTLLLKFHAKYKTKYIFRAHAWTIAPDNTSIFMSQRRRWINSTVHNLVELIPVSQLCGFCCFGMRFIVFVDLLSTIIQPTLIIYIIYLIVLVSTSSSVIPYTSLLLIGAVYGLQAIIFIVRRKWEMIGWMIVYILATPIFAFALPLYSFWHMDDFSWGNTRVVMGEKGQKVIISDEGKFDPASIPRKKWEEYQAELWEAQTHLDDTRSEVTGFSSVGTRSVAMYPGSVHAESFGPGANAHLRTGSLGGGGGGVGGGLTPGGYLGHPASEYGFPASISRPISQVDLLNHASAMSQTPTRLSFSPSHLSLTPPDNGIGGHSGANRAASTGFAYTPSHTPHPPPLPSTTPTPSNLGLGGAMSRRTSTFGNDLELSDMPPAHAGTAINNSNNSNNGMLSPSLPMHSQPQSQPQMQMPSDDAILAEIRDILRTADLMTVTKKSVKLELERRFGGVSMASKKAYISSATEAVLSGQL